MGRACRTFGNENADGGFCGKTRLEEISMEIYRRWECNIKMDLKEIGWGVD
jgi:hypothetical protein